MEKTLKEHLSDAGKKGIKIRNSKYPLEIRKQWSSKGGKIGGNKRWSKRFKAGDNLPVDSKI